jgi:hypothetical protein
MVALLALAKVESCVDPHAHCTTETLRVRVDADKRVAASHALRSTCRHGPLTDLCA